MSFKLNAITSHSRTIALKKNIIYSMSLKGISIFCSLLIVPLTINYLSAEEYGIWLTLSSILTWVNYFDIGILNGLRNKLGAAFAVGNIRESRILISTSFGLMAGIIGLIFIFFVLLNFFVDWNSILNIKNGNAALNSTVTVVFAFFCLQFLFKIIGIILIAKQFPAGYDMINALGSILSLSFIYILTKTVVPSLDLVAIVFSSAPVIVLIFATIILFFGKLSYLRPSIKLVDFSYSYSIIGLGLKFFIIQLAVNVVIYTSTNFILMQLFGGESVTMYNIAYKYFSILNMAYMIIINPIWSASTDAYHKSDYEWLLKTMIKVQKVFLISVPLFIIFLVISNSVYHIWVGNVGEIPFMLSFLVCIYCLLFNWSNSFIFFINGIGKIQLQMYITIVVAIFHFPLTFFLGQKFGVEGVVLGSVISLVPTSILMPLQCKMIFKGESKGIWDK